MLQRRNKLPGPEGFKRTVKTGRKAGTPTLLVHAALRADGISRSHLAGYGPRFGLIVSKAVGNAVTRHHVSRLIRAGIRDVLDSVNPQWDIVIRAFPAAGDADYATIRNDLATALATLPVVDDGR